MPVPASTWPRKPPKSKSYRNPVVLAQEWQAAIDKDVYASKADLARQKGLSRGRVTQVLNLLRLCPDILERIAALGDPMPSPIITERMLSPIVMTDMASQRREVENMLKADANEAGLS